jgi:Resolvase, N terminal domain
LFLNLFQNRGMIYGYARVSTEAQDLTSQLAQLKAAGCEKVFREKLTGTNTDRPQLRQRQNRAAKGRRGFKLFPNSKSSIDATKKKKNGLAEYSAAPSRPPKGRFD